MRNTIVVILLLLTTESWGANISFVEKGLLRNVLIEGEIQRGDYEKFIDAVLKAGSHNSNVFIASRGGDALEAMKIGSLIRKFRFETNVPKWFEEVGGVCSGLPVPKSNCACNSSCVLIYLSGFHRYGNYLGVHRTFVDHEQLKEMEMEEAAQLSKQISIALDSYLGEMGAPPSLLEKMESVASNNIEYLDDEYIQKYLGGYAREYQEWVLAKCGSASELHAAMRAESDKEKLKVIWEKFDNLIRCETDFLDDEQRKAFYPSIKDAFQNIDPSFIPRHSLLESLQGKIPFELSQLIGKSTPEAIDLLSLIGFRNTYTVEELSGFHGTSTVFEKSLLVGFGDNGVVYSVNVPFFSSEGVAEIFTRHFLTGLDRDSTPKDFIDKYGTPNRSRCTEWDFCVLFITTKNADLYVGFNEDKKLHVIKFNVPGYWERLSNKQ